MQFGSKVKNRNQKEVEMKKILVTGATGLVGNQLVKTLSKEFIVFAVSSRRELLLERFAENKNVKIFTNKEFLDGILPIDEVDTLIQCAFTRSNDPIQVVSATEYATAVIGLAKRKGVKEVLNISTRSLYQDPDEGQLNTENSPLKPVGTIGIAKHAIECMVNEVFKETDVRFSNLRLGSVNEVKTHDTMIRPMNVFADCVIEGKPIKVVSGTQVMSYIDPRDIADAIMALLKIDSSKWKSIYNIGTGWMATATLLEIAELVRDIGVNEFGLKRVDINVEPKDIVMRAGLDISRIQTDTGWTPKYSLKDMAVALYEMKLNKN